MIRVHVICEGQTEEMFVNQVLAEFFLDRNICLIPALIGKPGHKGGNFKFERLLTDVRARLLDDKTAYCTTFFDFYGLPEDFPGKEKSIRKNGMSQKADCLLEVLTEKLIAKLGEDPLRRFIPYVQMYEFEGLLFSHPEKLAAGINQTDLRNALQKIRDAFDSPEEINNSPITAPSKRIVELYSAYDKPIHGSLAAIEIGLDIIRQECQRFDEWLKKLEALQPKV
ncbi:DUF4276 family protein [Duganella sp. FT134W]|uniref:DUF4276 family protein n=1 Tax=Duganella margarita TaxID=2692170 RepID=A0A7X4H455_9BURK|nr:DUF4276 family protein [Duganella margarita]MYM74997.1 DUF4276 family protein [Duganella margarita]